jgi:cytochrome c
MSTLEINKMVAALLTTGVVAGFSAFVASVIMHSPELEEPSYVVAGAVSEDEPAEGAEGDAPADDMAAMMASAEEAAGEKVAKKCASCHTFDQGGANKIGPNLWNVLNRPIAGVGDFGYSDALTGMASDSWSYDSLNAFLKKPKDFAPGTKMSFAGLKKPEDRANLILYLRSQSDSPAPLPE